MALACSPGDASGTRFAIGAILDVPGDGGSGRRAGGSSELTGPCKRSNCESCSYNAAILALYIFSVPSLAAKLFRSLFIMSSFEPGESNGKPIVDASLEGNCPPGGSLDDPGEEDGPIFSRSEEVADGSEEPPDAISLLRGR